MEGGHGPFPGALYDGDGTLMAGDGSEMTSDMTGDYPHKALIRVVAWPPSLARPRRLPGRERLRCDPDSQAPALLQRAVILGPVLRPVARPRLPVTVGFIER
jgi:hypothetical protein